MPSLPKSLSKRATRFTHKHQNPLPAVQHTQRRPTDGDPSRSASHSEAPTTTIHPSPDVPIAESYTVAPLGSAEQRSLAITPSVEEPTPPRYLYEAPVPRMPQEDQEYDDQDEEPAALTEPQEPTPDDFPVDFNKELFHERLAQLLELELEVKDQEFADIKREKTTFDGRGFYEEKIKRVEGESIPIEDRTEIIDKGKQDSVGLTPFSMPSTSGQSSMESNQYQPQEIKAEEIERRGKLGAGTSGWVYLVRWHGAEVALKEFYGNNPQENEKSMRQETKTLSMLKHPCVVSLYGVCWTPKHPAIILEYMTGGSLRSQLLKLRKERGRVAALSARAKVQIALQAANAMEYLHSRNIIHFDIKADNFLCDLRDLNRPVVKVADVGLSKHKIAAFVTGSMRGTLPWMAPELFPQMPGQGATNRPYTPKRVNSKVDVYSFAIVLWEIWSVGADPYPEMSAADVLFRVLGGTLRPTISRDCHPEWAQLMQMCWDQNPTRRPPFQVIVYKLECMLKSL